MPDQLTRPLQTDADRKLLAQARETIDRSKQLLADTRLSQAPLCEQRAVTLTEVGSEWHVVVEDSGQEPLVRTFRAQHTAFIFAESQRKRLGLDKVTRM